jgi:single-stranded DNA-binding protein
MGRRTSHLLPGHHLRKTAQNALNSLTKGNTIIATGQLTARNYARTHGTAHEMITDHLGSSTHLCGRHHQPKN